MGLANGLIEIPLPGCGEGADGSDLTAQVVWIIQVVQAEPIPSLGRALTMSGGNLLNQPIKVETLPSFRRFRAWLSMVSAANG